MPLRYEPDTMNHRFRPTVIGMVAVATAGGTLLWAGGNPFEYLSGLAAANFDLLLGRVLGIASWFAWAWLTLAIVAELTSAAPGLAGRIAGDAASRLTPRVLRRLTQTLLGASLVIGPLTAVPAVAAPRSPLSTSGPATPASAAPTSAMSLDRPTVVVPRASDNPPSVVSLDRPSATAVAPTSSAPPYIAPVPTSRARTADPAPSALLSGTPHRSADDPGYVVRRGDALWNIAARHLGPHASAAEIARAWPRWYAANRAVIGIDPGVILPGQVLYAPTG